MAKRLYVDYRAPEQTDNQGCLEVCRLAAQGRHVVGSHVHQLYSSRCLSSSLQRCTCDGWMMSNERNGMS